MSVVDRVAEAIDGHTFGVDEEHPICYCGQEFISVREYCLHAAQAAIDALQLTEERSTYPSRESRLVSPWEREQ